MSEHDDHDEQDPRDLRPSRSQKKRDAEARQKLGEELAALTEKQLDLFQIADQLREAIRLARRVTDREGNRRQRQFIGRLMENEDCEAIQAVMDNWRNSHRNEVRQFHALEEWRDRLIAEGDSALNEFLVAYPTADRQHVRQLMKNAEREKDKNAPPASSRALFVYIKQLAATGKVDDK